MLKRGSNVQDELWSKEGVVSGAIIAVLGQRCLGREEARKVDDIELRIGSLMTYGGGLEEKGMLRKCMHARQCMHERHMWKG